ncbi:cytochrome c3 family protein [Thiorhodovibrio frisius]|nr:class III cytochrome C family protein [Thiorhodovibrio frisius]
MNKKLIFTIVAANLALLVLLAFLYPQAMIQPGKLIDAHADLETDCFACHTPFLGSQPDKCIECHKPAEIGLVTTKGLAIGNEHKLTPFHQDLIEQDCVACHSDHKGVHSFRPIGQFSHDLLQVNLRDTCSGCHNNPEDSLHRGIADNCGQCHSQQAWTPATIDHDRFFVLDRDHQASCQTCHLNNDVSRYTCYGCHEHSRSNIREEHVEEGIYDYENCVECHRSADEDDIHWEETDRHERRRRYLDAPQGTWDQDFGQERRGRHGDDDEDDDDDDDDDDEDDHDD